MCSGARNGANGTVTGHGHFLFQELRKQASSFLRTARLALTDATPAQLLTEEVANGNSSSTPDARTLGFITRAAFDQNDYCRIVEILHKRLSKFDKKLWREPYNALIILEHLLTHGPQDVADEFRGEEAVIGEMCTLQYIDEKGFNWGLTVKNKSETVLKLLEDQSFLNEQRERAQKISHEIHGFGSFNLTLSSTSNGTYQNLLPFIARSNSNYESCRTQEVDESDNDMNLNSEFGNSDKVLSDKVIEKDESKPFLAHQEEPKVNVSEKILNYGTVMNMKSDNQQEKTICNTLSKSKTECGSFKRISCESEPLLTHEEEPKVRNVYENSLNCGVQMNRESEFRHWPENYTKVLANKAPPMDESEPFLPLREEKQINNITMLDHPFNFDHQGSESLLLRSS